MKYYMEKDENYTYTLDYFIDDYDDGTILLEMKRDIGGEMFCKEFMDFVPQGECGKDCEHYDPCNGVSGRCIELQNGFITTGKKYIINNGKITLA